jgi:hypothetical protein
MNERVPLAMLAVAFLGYAFVDSWAERKLKRDVELAHDLIGRIAMVQAKALDREMFAVTNTFPAKTIVQTNNAIIVERLKHRWHEGEPEPIFWHTIDIGLQANAELVWRPHTNSP